MTPATLPQTIMTIPTCCGHPMHPTGMGATPTRPAYVCNKCDSYCGPLGARTPAQYWRRESDGRPAWLHAQGEAYDVPAGEPTLGSIRAALLSIAGVRYAQVLDRNIVPRLGPATIAAVVIGDRKSDAWVSRVLGANLPVGVISVGTEEWDLVGHKVRWYTFASAPQHLRDACIAIAVGLELDVLSTELHGIARRKGEPDEGFRVRMQDPMEVEYDGEALSVLLDRDRAMRIEGERYIRPSHSHAQRAAISAHWSAQLRAKVEASRADDEARKTSVVIGIDADDLTW